MTLFRPEYSKSGGPCSAEAPYVEDTDLRLELFDGVAFEDDPRAAPPRPFIKIPGPALHHSPMGCSASVAVGESRPEQQRRKYRTNRLVRHTCAILDCRAPFEAPSNSHRLYCDAHQGGRRDGF